MEIAEEGGDCKETDIFRSTEEISWSWRADQSYSYIYMPYFLMERILFFLGRELQLE